MMGDNLKKIEFKEILITMMTLYVSPYGRFARRRGVMARRVEEENHNLEYNDQEKVLAVDVKSDDVSYTISALIPGIEADEIDVEILNNTVSIRGEFKGKNGDENDQLLVSELPLGHFSRVLTLPTKLDPAKADANLKQGVFTLRVPKAEEDRPKLIKISAN
jgi:HSP20 family protein